MPPRRPKADPTPAESNADNVQPLRPDAAEPPAASKEDAAPKAEPTPVPLTPAAAPEPEPIPEPTAEQYLTRRQALLATVPPADKRPKSIYGKLAQLLGLIRPVPKLGRNDFHKYDYAKESDLVEAVRPLLSEYGIFFWWTLIDEERRSQSKRDRDGAVSSMDTLTVVRIRFMFIDGESGQTTDEQEIVAYGDDPGDKGIYKALTGAVKYALMKTFLISTGDDPEADKATDRRSAAAEASSHVDVRRSGPPQQRRGAQPPPRQLAAGPADEAPEESQPASQPGPGGRQAGANPPAKRQLSELLKATGEVHGTIDAAALIGKIVGVTIPMEGDDKPAALAAWLKELEQDRQAYGKLLFDLRKYIEDKTKAAEGETATESDPDLEAGDAL